ncbi:MAG: MFS transporter [Bacteroidales bacterium]|jgi:MFS family permease|nr:MFS transporter [Bacteroidales bacterium]MDD3300130.1 MFS transporter [Bacteroidales bacterium]MDD3843473.1 MFS transporter [Bacteroidales bacterium]MDD4617786.1 MFS transporter [Bacteroidales bacterium]
MKNPSVQLRDSAPMRWLMLLLVALTMFAAYVASDIFSPLQTMLERHNQWNPSEYGWFAGSYSIFNVFLGMLIFGGIILDKKGIRFSGLMSCILMVIGIAIKYWAVTDDSLLGNSMMFLGSEYKMQVVWAVVGFGIFGVGAEVAGITVSKSIVKWFKGKELALAMGMQLSLARLGSAAALAFSPMIATRYSNVSAPVLFGLVLLVLGTLAFAVYSIYDKKLDTQIKADELEPEESFNAKDLKAVLNNKGFWLIAILCVVFYSAVFPFLKYAAGLMEFKFGVDPQLSGLIPSMLPFGAIVLTPLFGRIYDKIGHGADLMIAGSVLLVSVHVLFAMPFIDQWWMAIILMILLGIAFSMVPSAMWPSLAKIMPERQLGTTYALTFYIQNIGLMLVPILIGNVLNKYSIVGTIVKDGMEVNQYDYTLTMSIFAAICSLAIVVSLVLKFIDKKMGYGLQFANMEKKN